MEKDPQNEDMSFDRAAKDYDKWFDAHANWFLSELEALKQAIPGTGKGLEIGVGTGRFATDLGIETGVEPAANMAAIAIGRGIKVIPGLAEDLPFAGPEFDFTLMVTVDCFLQDMQKAFAEARRVTRPGGRIIIGMIDRSSPPGKKYQNLKQNNPYYKYAHFHDVEEVKKQLQEAGFENFRFWQTLIHIEEENFETPQEGYGKGGFVVIDAQKSKDIN